MDNGPVNQAAKTAKLGKSPPHHASKQTLRSEDHEHNADADLGW